MPARFATLITAVAVAALLIALVPTVAEAAAISPWGWVTARKPTTASYTPAAKDQGNSAGGTNTIQRVFPGRYDVIFGDLDASSGCTTDGCLGTAVATAMSTSQRWCVVGDLTSSLPVTIYVVCRDRNGNYADSAFSLNFVAALGVYHKLAYLYANDPSNSFYYPDEMYDYNSEKPSSEAIQRLGVGYYFVYLTDIYAETRGNFQINGTLGTCKIEDTQNNNDPTDIYTGVYVRCRDFSGNPADNAFFLTYSDGQVLKVPPGDPAAYVFANKPTTASYHPGADFSYSSAGQAATITRSGRGSYQVKLPGMPFGGSAQVSAFGTGKSQCQLSSISGKTTPQKIGVRCYSASGSLVDTKFYLSFIR